MPSELNAEELAREIHAAKKIVHGDTFPFNGGEIETLAAVIAAAEAHLATLRAPKDELAEARITYLRSCLQAIASQSVWNSVESSKYALEQDDPAKARATGGDRCRVS